MKTKQIQQIHLRLAAALPSYASSGRLLYEKPLGHVLRGFYFDDSRFSAEDFYVWVFCLPLYVPQSSVTLSFGKKLNTVWSTTSDYTQPLLRSMGAAEQTFLSLIRTPSTFAEHIAQLTEAPKNLHVQEAIAYSLIFAHERDRAVAALRDLCESVSQFVAEAPHLEEIKERAQILLQAVEKDGKQAMQQLRTWEVYSCAKLRLPLPNDSAAS